MKALTWKCRTKISIRFQNFRVTYPKTYINLELFQFFVYYFQTKQLMILQTRALIVQMACWVQRQMRTDHPIVQKDRIHFGQILKIFYIHCNSHKCCYTQTYRFQDLDRVHYLTYRLDSIILDHLSWDIITQ